MVSEVVTYNDLEGNEVTEKLYFNLTRAEVSELSLGLEGGWEGLQARVNSDFKGTFEEYYNIIKRMIAKAYGVKSKDGKALIKPEEERLKFEASEAYSVIVDRLFNDETGEAMVNFMQKATEGARLNSSKNKPALAVNNTAADA